MLEQTLLSIYPTSRKEYIRALTSSTGGELLMKYGVVTSALRFCHFLSQCAHETGGFRVTHESGNYSAKRLLEIFGKYFPADVASSYVGRPEAILSRAYAKRLGNGDEASGDGWRYRGRGFLQETGKENYQKRSVAAAVDLVTSPDLAAEPTISLKIALDRWSISNLNEFADGGPTHDAILAVSRGINLGDPTSKRMPNGLQDREKHFFKLWANLKDLNLADEKVIATLITNWPSERQVFGSAGKAMSDGKREGFLSTSQQERLAAALNKHLGIPLLFSEEEEQQIFIKIVQSIDRHIYSVVPKEITDKIKDRNATVTDLVIEGLKSSLVSFLSSRIPLPFLFGYEKTILSEAVNIITDALRSGVSLDDLLDDLL